MLVVATWYPTEREPTSAVFVQDQVRLLARRYDVAVVAPDLRSIRVIARSGLGPRMRVTTESTGTKVARPRAVSPVPGMPTFVVDSWSRAVSTGFEALRVTWGKPDLIHAHVLLNGGFAAARLGKQLNVPVILTEHATETSTWLKTVGRPNLIREALLSIPIHIAVSPSLAARIRSIAPVDVRVIGNVIDTDYFIASPTREPHAGTRFAYVGSLIGRKGIDTLLRAGARLRDGHLATWEVQIAGQGPERRALERMSAQLGLEGNVRFIGPATRMGVRGLYEWADYGLFPSRHETFGVAAAEAMAMGRPLIGTRNGGFEFVMEPGTGVLVPPDDPKALADAMAEVITGKLVFDPAFVRASIVRRFGPEAFLDAISGVYAEALSLGRGAE